MGKSGAAPDPPELDRWAEEIRAGNRVRLAQAITLVESARDDHRALAAKLIELLLPATGNAIRIGVTGVPGVGKSTFIERFGTDLTAEGHRVAVLAVDPSSTLRGGSILGDKTRMNRLAVDERAFVRPSPTSGTLGGVAAATREAMLLCEAAGFDVVVVETVGVGQSETTVAGMTDLFVALMLPGAGDELQGIKRGLLELSDLIAVNKADGDRVQAARRAARDYKNALQYSQRKDPEWEPPVLVISALEGQGVDELREQLWTYHRTLKESGALERKRAEQRVQWLQQSIDLQLRAWIRQRPAAAELWRELEGKVRDGEVATSVAAAQILAAAGLT